jgi:hypothetical protein
MHCGEKALKTRGRGANCMDAFATCHNTEIKFELVFTNSILRITNRFSRAFCD